MKSYFTIVCFLILFLVSSFTDSFAQTDWEKYEGNPVLVPGSPGDWDDFSLWAFSILFDGSTYHLWYGGHDGTYARIGYATSPDGKAWTPYKNNPVMDVGEEGSWDDLLVLSPYVLFDGDTYHMWYHGSNGTNDRIGYATSTDRVTWEKYESNPVMVEGLEGSWEVDGLDSPCVLFDGSTYHMWYHGWDDAYHRICYATSTDRVTWTKYESNPVLDIGLIGSWDRPRVLAPDVFFDGTTYHMWYSGNSADWTDRIGYATSADGITWTKFAGNPVLDVGKAGDWDDQWAGRCRVLKDTANSMYKMWYAGSDVDMSASMGYATAPDTIPVSNCEEISSELPINFVLVQNYPNPFNPSTTIEFTLPKSEYVELKVYNILGKEVSTLVSNKLNQGNHTYTFDGKNLASGVYYYQLVAGEYREVKKMILLK